MSSSYPSSRLSLDVLKTKYILISFILCYIIMHIYSNIHLYKYFKCTSNGKKPAAYPNKEKTPLLIHENANTSTLQRTDFNYDFRNMESTQSIEEMAFLLNIRKLIVYSVHELNKPLQLTGCVKWWANPLDFISYGVLSTNKTHSTQEIKFKVQPGNIRFKVIIMQKHPPIQISDTELEILSPPEPLDTIPFEECYGIKTLHDTIRKTCLCSTANETKIMENQTSELRVRWELLDKESVSWPLTMSFSISDYLNFTDYQSFVISPGKSEVIENGYSTEYCGPDVKMLIMVSSAPSNVNKRKIIRDTYANPIYLKGKGVKVVFLVGVLNNQTLNDEIVKEAGTTKDIIQANFVDSYHNLTLSHLSMYKWFYLTCGQEKHNGIHRPKHILKADDDFLLNVDLALKVAENNSNLEFIGVLLCGTGVVRDVNYMEKYYTPRYMHISGSYVGYLSGVTYLMRTDVIPRLLHMSLTTPLIHMDDAYITGILLRQLEFYPQSSPLFTYGRTEPDSCLTKKMVNSYVLNPDDMIVEWKKLIEPAPPNCSLENLILKVPELEDHDKRSCFFE